MKSTRKDNILGARFLNGQGNASEDKYLAWSNSMRLDLQSLGLERRAKKIIDLKSYLDQNASNQQ